MSATAYGASRTTPGPILVAAIALLVVLLAFGIVITGKMAVFALIGLFFFVLFVQWPVLGLYATTVLLLLSGSQNVISLISEQTPLAMTLSRLCGMAALAAWLINMLLRKMKFEFNWPVLWISAFCGWTAVCTLVSAYAGELWPEWFRLMNLLLYLLLAVNVLDTTRKLHYYIILLLACAAIMSFVSFAQYLMPSLQVAQEQAWARMGGAGSWAGAYIDPESLAGEPAIRVSGRQAHSLWLAMTLLLLLPLHTYWWTTAKTKTMRTLIILMVLLEVVTLVLTFTRTAFLVGIVIGLMLWTRHLVRMNPLRFFGFLLILVIGYTLLPNAYKERVLSPKQYVGSQSVQSRLALQEAAWDYTMENPIFGTGPGGFGENFIRETNETATTMRFMVLKQAWNAVFIGTHNLYLQLSANQGLVGLALYLVFFVLTLRKLWVYEQQLIRDGDIRGATLAGAVFVSLIGFALCGVFLHALMQKIWWMVAAVAIVIPMYRMNFKEGLSPGLSISSEAPVRR
ncbi:MAG: O-antigen ligase family protein [Candidatus Hydrogenedentes bacterium]|nr:O-antigen ligase family protein [Candidatus Hydrogenedentota bacterium]